MDHLQTDQERRARWYSHTLPPVRACRASQTTSRSSEPPEKHTPKRMVFHRMATKRTPKIPRDLLASVLDRHGFVVVSWSLGIERNAEGGGVGVDWIGPQVSASCSLQTDGRAGLPCPSDPFDILICPLSSRRRGGMIPFTGQGTLPLRGRFGHMQTSKLYFRRYMKRQIISSLDGIVMWRAGREHATDRWFHLDQNPILKPGLQCIQACQPMDSLQRQEVM
jgi:hypothetical protein